MERASPESDPPDNAVSRHLIQYTFVPPYNSTIFCHWNLFYRFLTNAICHKPFTLHVCSWIVGSMILLLQMLVLILDSLAEKVLYGFDLFCAY